MSENHKAQILRRRADRFFLTAIHCCREALISALLLLFALPALSEPPTILLIKSGTAAVYQEVSTSIRTALENHCPECASYQVKTISLEDGPNDQLNAHHSDTVLIVTIGVSAARLITESDQSIPRLYTLIPRTAADSMGLVESAPTASVLYLDQPIRRQLNLVKLITSKNQVLGVLFGPTTAGSRALLESAAGDLGIPLQTDMAEVENEIGPALKNLLDHSDIILALPDPLIYNRNTIFNILLSSYHHRVPLIGFSASYVKAGAMLAVHSTPQQIGMHISEIIQQFIKNAGEYLPDSEYPRYFSIEVNPSVADSLDINLPDADELQQHLKRMEGQ